MIVDETQIEKLVRQVLDRLGQTEANGAQSRPQTTTGDGELILTERVVTMDTLEGRLDGVRRAIVCASAIVTPAARDALAQKSIECIRRDGRPPSSSRDQCTADLVVASVDRAQVQQAEDALERGVMAISATTLADTVHDICRHVSTGNARGLLITEQPAAAVCIANRNRKIRAAHIVEHGSVGEIAASIGANLLIIDSRGLSGFQLKRLVQAAAKTDEVPCPAELRGALEAAN